MNQIIKQITPMEKKKTAELPPILIPVSVKDELPDKNGFYYTDLGQLKYDNKATDEMKWSQHCVHVGFPEYWYKEKTQTPPSSADLEKEADELWKKYSSTDYTGRGILSMDSIEFTNALKQFAQSREKQTSEVVSDETIHEAIRYFYMFLMERGVISEPYDLDSFESYIKDNFLSEFNITQPTTSEVDPVEFAHHLIQDWRLNPHSDGWKWRTPSQVETNKYVDEGISTEQVLKLYIEQHQTAKAKGEG